MPRDIKESQRQWRKWQNAELLFKIWMSQIGGVKDPAKGAKKTLQDSFQVKRPKDQNVLTIT